MVSRVPEFRRLHESGCFVIPNPWDVGSARYLEHLGFRALASTSAGFAWSQGRRDNTMALDRLLAHFTSLAESVSIPVAADFEDGLAPEPEGVARHVGLAVHTGIAGLSIEDSTRSAPEPLYDLERATDRIRAAREAIDHSGTGALLTARCESYLVGRPDLASTVARLQAYAEAGADCLFAPGISTREEVDAVVKGVAPKPVNLIVVSPWITVSEAEALGVRRISVGGALARAAWRGFDAAASEILSKGSFGGFAGPRQDLDSIFG